MMVYAVVRILVIAICCTVSGLRAMHLLQLGRYQTPELSRELSRNRDRILWTDFGIAAGATALNWYLPVFLSMFMPQTEARETLCNWLMLVLFAGATAFAHFEKQRIPVKKEFNLSQRMGRLMGFVLALNVLGATVLHLLALSPYLMFAACDFIVLPAAWIIAPLENRINAGYYRAARLKLAEHKKLIRIGISGSYGKTETKLILKAILSEKFRVLATPPSFSSAMGASRVINEQLNKKHQIFIAELGGQKKGEVREIARVIRPRIGILTCVGEAHADSYGSLEAVAQGQYELMQNLSEGGVAFFGSDGGFGNRLYALCPLEKYRASLEGAPEDYMRAEHLETGVRGSRFELVCADGERCWVETKLLGRYAARNIALAAAVARKLGMSMEEIRQGASKIRPILGHMQLILGDIHVIDDSLNTLPEAAGEALEVLHNFPGRRIVVTAGLTQLTSGATEANYQLGMQIATHADYAILIDPEGTRQVQRGINKNGGIPGSSMRVVSDVEDAEALVREIAEEGDSVLWEGVAPEPEDEGEE